LHQSCPHGILNPVLNFRVSALLASEDSIKRFALLNLSNALQQVIDLVRGGALDALHYLGDAVEAIAILQRSENQMNMVGHHYCSVQVVVASIAPPARFYGNSASG